MNVVGKAAVYALCLSGAWVLGPLLVYTAGETLQLILGIGTFPVLFLGFWLYGSTRKDALIASNDSSDTGHRRG